jgi:hypothetical protein
MSMLIQLAVRSATGELLVRGTFRTEYRRAADGAAEIVGISSDSRVASLQIDADTLVDIPEDARPEQMRAEFDRATERVLANTQLWVAKRTSPRRDGGAPPPEVAEPPELPDTDAQVIECDRKPLSCTLGLRLKIRAFARDVLPTMGPLEEVFLSVADHEQQRGPQYQGRTATAEDWPRNFRRLHLEFHDVLQHLAEIDRESATEASAWRTVVQQIRHAEHEGALAAARKVWEIEEGRSIIWTPRGISVKIDRGNNVLTLPVIAGYFRPWRSLVVESWTYFEVGLTPTDRVTASAEDIYKRLERDGRIRKRRFGHDVVAETLNEMAVPSGVAHPVYGIYDNGEGVLEECLAPVPIRDEQFTVHEDIKDGLQYEPRVDDFAAWARFAAHFDRYEVLPAMGLSAISPVVHTLRANDRFVPHVWNYSLAHGLGKSTVLIAFSRELWGREQTTGSGIDSRFRMSAVLDGSTVPLCVEEGETLNLRLLGPDLKASAERPIVTRRGSTAMNMVPFGSRCCLFVSGNKLPARSGPLLSRLLAPRFNSSRVEERKRRKPEMDSDFAQLRPIGRALGRTIIRDHPRIDSLLLHIHDLERKITARGAATGDIRRPQAWAVVYAGLETWASAAAFANAPWELLPLSQFIDEVVVPVDNSTYDSEETVVDAFRSWFEMWRAKNVVRSTVIQPSYGSRAEQLERTEEIRGKGSLFVDGYLQVDPKRKIPGYWVTQSLLSEYNKQAATDLCIGSLKELAIAAADQADYGHDQVLEPSGQVKKAEFEATTEFREIRRARAAFVPRDRDAPQEDDGE